MRNKYTCPVCGYLVFEEPPGSYDICPICFWEDDISQLKFPKTNGANKVSLLKAQENYPKLGAVENRLIDYTRLPKEADVKDPDWRPIDTESDNIEEQIYGKDYSLTYPDNPTDLYYWRKRG